MGSYSTGTVSCHNLTFIPNRDPFLRLSHIASATMASKRVEQIAAHLNFPKGMLAGQVAIITGSGQGIGAEVARLFSNEGAKVVVSDIDAGKAKKVADDINAFAPSFENNLATSAPIPCPEPVMMATCPASMPLGKLRWAAICSTLLLAMVALGT